jgi:hypothetical protein
MLASCDDTDELVARASRGDETARHELLNRHRARLRRMVALRLDARLAVDWGRLGSADWGRLGSGRLGSDRVIIVNNYSV